MFSALPAIIFLMESKVLWSNLGTVKNFSRYNGDVRRRRSWHFRLLLRGDPIASHCYHILIYIPDLVVALTTWYLF